MTARSTRKRYHRRERRKAKQSQWQREPKGNPKKVGHGPGSTGHGLLAVNIQNQNKKKETKYAQHLNAIVAELVDAPD